MAKIDGATLMARSLKQQGVDYMFGIVGFPVQGIAAAAQHRAALLMPLPMDFLPGSLNGYRRQAYGSHISGFSRGPPNLIILTSSSPFRRC